MIDELTVRRMTALSRHWEKYPPVHVSLAALLEGLSGSRKPEPQPQGNLAELMASFPEAPLRRPHG